MGNCAVQSDGPIYLTSQTNVQLIVAPSVPNPSVLPAGAADWQGGCPNSPNLPAFSVTSGTQRTPPQDITNSILVKFVPDSSDGQNLDGFSWAIWDANDNSITLYGKIGTKTVDWSDPFAHWFIAHELGHALGLDHDTCAANSLMKGTLKPSDFSHGTHPFILFPQCRQVDYQNCNPFAGEGKVCPPDPRTVTPISRFGGVDICESLPELCPIGGGAAPWISYWDCVPSGTVTVAERCWGVQPSPCPEPTVPTPDLPANPIGIWGAESWTCTLQSFLTARTSLPLPAGGAGPWISVLTPSEAQTVSGSLDITGAVAHAELGTGSMAFWLDGLPLQLDNFVRNVETVGACEQPVASDPSCPYIGFSGSLDTRSIADGSHTLQVVAIDRRTVYPRPTYIERIFTVDNSCKDLQQPTVVLASPSAGSTVTGPTLLQAAAADNGTLTKVEFFVDGIRVGGDTTAPYTWVWNSAAAGTGSHSLKARAFDACGNAAWSTSVSVQVAIDTTAPMVSLTAPAAGAIVRGIVPLQATSSDAFGVTRVEFFLDGALIATDSNAPYAASWNTVAAASGLHTLQAKAYDTSGNVGSSATVSVNVANDLGVPAVSFLAPTGGAIVRSTVAVQASATDDVAVVRVDLAADGVTIGTDTTAPYAFSWNSTNVAEGVHTLTLRAYDAASNLGTATRSVTVDNIHPQVRIVSGDRLTILPGSTYSLPSTPVNTQASRGFTIFNDGNEALTIANPGTVTAGAGYSQVADPPPVVAPGATGAFRIRLWSSIAGTFTGSAILQTNELGASPFGFNLVGTVSTLLPNLAVLRAWDGSPVAKGSTVAIGTSTVGVATSLRFRIENSGAGNLNLTDPTALVSGSAFSLIETPQSPVAPGSSAYFRVRLQGAGSGTFFGTVSIRSDDPEDSPYEFTVSGVVN